MNVSSMVHSQAAVCGAVGPYAMNFIRILLHISGTKDLTMTTDILSKFIRAWKICDPEWVPVPQRQCCQLEIITEYTEVITNNSKHITRCLTTIALSTKKPYYSRWSYNNRKTAKPNCSVTNLEGYVITSIKKSHGLFRNFNSGTI
uniref:Secreted protein n=1 Tax=Heterorhabditis bacteriophora TaxID=37862 RepID=A0A1I7WZH1_HETBA